MGGVASGISESTKNICIESAVFDPVKIRLTAQRLGLRSDASTRFEKSLDPHFSSQVLARACQVFNFSGVGGNITAKSTYLSPMVKSNVTIQVSLGFIQSRLGITLDEKKIHSYLSSLGFIVESTMVDGMNTFQITVPSHRATKDISIAEDIVEEIARLIGFDEIPELPLHDTLQIVPSSGHPQFKTLLQDYFRGIGMYEVYNYSFSNEKKDELVGITDHSTAIMIRNAVSAEYTCMRRSLAPLLLQ